MAIGLMFGFMALGLGCLDSDDIEVVLTLSGFATGRCFRQSVGLVEEDEEVIALEGWSEWLVTEDDDELEGIGLGLIGWGVDARWFVWGLRNKARGFEEICCRGVCCARQYS